MRLTFRMFLSPEMWEEIGQKIHTPPFLQMVIAELAAEQFKRGRRRRCLAQAETLLPY